MFMEIFRQKALSTTIQYIMSLPSLLLLFIPNHGLWLTGAKASILELIKDCHFDGRVTAQW